MFSLIWFLQFQTDGPATEKARRAKELSRYSAIRPEVVGWRISISSPPHHCMQTVFTELAPLCADHLLTIVQI